MDCDQILKELEERFELRIKFYSDQAQEHRPADIEQAIHLEGIAKGYEEAAEMLQLVRLGLSGSHKE